MNRPVLWVSTSLDTKGGVASAVRALQQTQLWDRWAVHHIATHKDGSVAVRMVAFARGAVSFLLWLSVRRPRLVHLHSASYGSFARKSLLAWVCYAVRVPVVIHVHGGGFAAFFQRSPGLVRRYISATLERAAAVVALGDVWARRLADIAPSARITVVPNGVRGREAVRQPAPGEPVTVLFLGAVIEDKGVFGLIDAWSEVLQSMQGGVRPRLVIAGGGDLERARACAAALDLDSEVELLGWVDPEHVDDLLSASQILVLPSRAEGQPMAVLEAMAAGLCVVVTPVGGVPDLVDQSCAIMVPVDDGPALAAALTDVVAHVEKRVRLGTAARARVREHFDSEAVAARLDALYGTVAK